MEFVTDKKEYSKINNYRGFFNRFKSCYPHCESSIDMMLFLMPKSFQIPLVEEIITNHSNFHFCDCTGKKTIENKLMMVFSLPASVVEAAPVPGVTYEIVPHSPVMRGSTLVLIT